MTQQNQQSEENKEIVRQIVLAVEFLVKHNLPFRGHRDDKVKFATADINRGNFIATLQLLAKGNSLLQNTSFLPNKMQGTPAKPSKMTICR